VSKYRGFLIYGLKDPLSGKIRYVGRSSNGLKRPTEHMRPHALARKTHRSSWIKSVLAKGTIPEVVILERTEFQNQLNDLEKKWITKFRNDGIKLVNHTDGGDGIQGFRHTKESRKKISEASKRNRPKGTFFHSKETKKLIGEESRSRPPQSEETKLKKSLGQTTIPFEAFEYGKSIGIFQSRSKFCRDFGVSRHSLVQWLRTGHFKSTNRFTFKLREDLK
jgi:NUMOD3 motif